MNVAVEVVHQEPAGDRDAIFLGDILIEQVFEFHAGGNVPALPQDIDHLAPPPHSWVAPFGACLSNDVRGEAEEGRRMRHPVAHEAGQQLLGVKDRHLSALSRRLYVHALGLEACAPLVPVGKRRREEETLPVGQGSNAESADGATEKILILIQLHDVIRCGGVRQNSIPGPRLLRPTTLTLVLAMHRSYLRRGALLVPGGAGVQCAISAGAGTPTAATLLKVKRRLVGYRADRRHAGLRPSHLL